MGNISLSLNDLSDQQLRDVLEITKGSSVSIIDDDSEDTEKEESFNAPEHLSPDEQARHWKTMSEHSQYSHHYLRDRHGFYEGETKKLESEIEKLVNKYKGLLIQNGYDKSELARHWCELRHHYEHMQGLLYHWNNALEEYTKDIQERFEELEGSFRKLSDMTNMISVAPSQP